MQPWTASRSATIAAALATLLAVAPFAAPALAEPEPPRILAPTFGRPVWTAPGATVIVTLSVAIQMPGGGEARLTNPRSGHSFVTAARAARPNEAASTLLEIAIPDAAARGTYDLEITLGAVRIAQPHAVSIARLDAPIRLVHLSDMGIGDISAPDFDPALIDEVNWVAPDAIVCTGDYLDRAHPNPEAGWRRLVDWIQRFDAPVVLALGDQDDPELFARHAAPSPVGAVQIGWLRALVLCDHAGSPIDRDAAQMRWLEEQLRAGDAKLTLIAAHDDRPNVLASWRAEHKLGELIRAGRIGLFFAGGSRDWDGREHRDLADAASPALIVRTGAASSSTRGAAAGRSRYRVLDVYPDRVACPADPDGVADSPSIEVGRLAVRADGDNDGSRPRVALTFTNNLSHRLDRLSAIARIAKSSVDPPWVRGAKLDEVIDRGTFWECTVRADVPDRGAVVALIGVGPTPAEDRFAVRFDVPPHVLLRRAVSADGIEYLRGDDVAAQVRIVNQGEQEETILPLVRLDGDRLAYRVDGVTVDFAAASAIRLAPRESCNLRLDFSAITVREGRRELQVYLAGREWMSPTCRPLEIRISKPAGDSSRRPD